jgi:antitoxin (DNA-binding transcriptional repressor) of toxin-antitoxin stability system
MKSVSSEYAASHLAELLQEVAAGNEVVILVEGEPAARLGPPSRGRDGDQDDPHAPSDEVEQAFYGD